MKKTVRFISLLCVLLLLFTFVACTTLEADIEDSDNKGGNNITDPNDQEKDPIDQEDDSSIVKVGYLREEVTTLPLLFGALIA